MKISVSVIAHNEEKYIAKCLDSLMCQTKLPDEILLIAHNCTDRTIEIAKKYPSVRIVDYRGPFGIPYARAKGFEESIGDIVVSTDGDSYSEKEWIEKITKPLLSNPDIVGVGTRVYYYGSIFSWWAYIKSFYIKRFLTSKSFYFFGPSSAVRKNYYYKVGGLMPFVELKKSLPLINCPEDCYLALALSQIGKVVLVTDKNTKVFAISKNKGFRGAFIRPFEQMKDAQKLYKYFSNKK